LYQLAWVLVDLGRDTEADDVFGRIHEECQASRYWADATYRLAERAARAKDFARADALARDIVERAKEPRMVAYALYLQGQLAATAKRWNEVIEPLRRLLDEYPASSQRLPAQYWLAESYYRQRQYQKAETLLAELYEKTRDRQENWVAMIPLRRAQVLAHHRQWEQAYQIASQIEGRFPEFSLQYEVDYLIGRYHARRAEFEEAREAYVRVVRSERGRATETAAVAQWMIGETYFMQKQYNQAIKAYFRVEGLHDFPRWKAAALLQAGKCHEMVGRWQDAAELYDKVVTAYRQTSFAQKAAERLRLARQRAGSMQTR
jgi:TolA-binding protein